MAPQSTLPPPAPPSSTRFELVVKTQDKVEVFPLTDSRAVTLGRSNSNAVRVDDPAVSRNHLRVHKHGDVVEVEDLGSANHTLLLRGSVPPAREASMPPAPLPPHERVTLRVGDSLRLGSAVVGLQARSRPSQSQLKLGSSLTGKRVLVDPAMKAAYALISRAAKSDIPVLILGETGVGKELMAEAVHHQSKRSAGRFLLLNCAALPEALLESELFGHEKGAFTGAQNAKPGLLEATDGGTVFLDEVGELPLGTQAKLLRVLEEHTVLRVGATKPHKINVRFVTATNRDLGRQIRDGLFRSDLYYRISGLVVRIPPLRERTSEIEPLARHFLRQFSEGAAAPALEIAQSAIDALVRHSWPGNVRELRNVMERAAIVADQGIVRAEHILLDPSLSDEGEAAAEFDGPTEVHTPLRVSQPGAEPHDERAQIMAALERCGGNQTRAAELLGISRRTLINRLEKWNLPRPKKR